MAELQDVQESDIVHIGGKMVLTHTKSSYDYQTKENYTFEQWQTLMADSSIQFIDCHWLDVDKIKSSENFKKSLLTPKQETRRRRITTLRSP